MVEGRAIIHSIESAKERVEALGAQFQATYSFKDIIFVPKTDEVSLNDDYVKIRLYYKNNWPTKDVVLVRKQTEFQSTGKVDYIVLKKEFDTQEAAFAYVQDNLADAFQREFAFERTGWQYQLDKYRIFIEDIAGMRPTIEIEADTDLELATLFDTIGIVETCTESIPELLRQARR